MRRRTALLLFALASACTGPDRTLAPAPPSRLPSDVSAATTSARSPVAPAASASAPEAPSFPADWPYPSKGPPVRSARGVIATDAALASKVGADVLVAGGNAVDAAVAAAFALAVVFPTAGNIGGGGFLVGRVNGKSYALDFRETAPAAATRDMYLLVDGGTSRDSRDGWRSAGTPGSVAGLWEAWHKLGSGHKTWAELVRPAIDLADRGFVVDAAFVKTVSRARERLARDPASAKLFLPNGAPPVVGSAWRDPELAGVLRRIAAEGPMGFYDGAVAAGVARAMRDHGGLLTAQDLSEYRAVWRSPIEVDYRGRHVVGMPPPSSGGLTLAMIANIVSGWDLRALGWHSAEHIHLVAEAMRRAFAARNAKLGDPNFVENPVTELLSTTWADRQRSTIARDRATPTGEILSPGPPYDGGTHTTHLAVADAEGNAVGLTTTINAWFGSCTTVPGLGFVLNDEMDDFAAVPGNANMFGLVQGEANAIAPRKRMLSSMSPTLVLAPDGQVQLVLGAAGGSTIITTVFEELSNVVDFDMTIADSVRAPRFHQQDWPDRLLLEAHSLPAEVLQKLQGLGHVTTDLDHIADAPALGRSGALWEASDEPRRDGSLALGL